MFGKMHYHRWSVKNVTDHAHAPESEVDTKFNNNLRKRARDEVTALTKLYNGELASLVLQEKMHTLSSYNAVERALYRHCRQSTPKLPQTRAEVTLENECTETTGVRNFLAVNDGDKDNFLSSALRKTFKT